VKISKEIKVALLGIVALVILYFGFMFLKGTDLFSDFRTYYVVYENVDGLVASNPVMLNGVRVGNVKELTLMTEKGNQIQVALAIRKDLDVGDSTVAALANSDLLGSKAIVLYMGNNTTLYDGGQTLIAYKESSITDIISSKSVPVIDKVDTTLARVNRLLDEESNSDIHAILANTKATTEAISQILRANQDNISQITANISALTSSLRQTERQINRLATNMAQLTDTLKQAEINQLVKSANQTVTELEKTVAKLNSNQGSMGRLLNDEQLYENLNRSTEALNLLLRDVQAYPKRYVQFSLIGRRDKYKVDETGRVITLDEVKTLQDKRPAEFRTAPDTVYVPVPDTVKAQSMGGGKGQAHKSKKP